MVVIGSASYLNSLQQSLPVNQGANLTTRMGNNNMEYKLHDPVQRLLIWSINSTTLDGIINMEYKLHDPGRDY